MSFKIFVINHIPTLRRRTLLALEQAGYSSGIIECKTIYEAQVIIDENPGCFLVIQELGIDPSPHREFEFLKQILKNRESKRVLFIMTSQLPDENLAKEIANTGAGEFL